MSNSNTRSSETLGPLLRLDRNELKSIKVKITRRDGVESNAAAPLARSIDDPAQLNIHYRPDEGVRPIFDRDDVLVNRVIIQDERLVRCSPRPEQKTARSRSSSRSSRSSLARKPVERRSSQSHSTREYERGRSPPRHKNQHPSRYRRSRSGSRKAVYKARSPSPRRKRSPPRRDRVSPNSSSGRYKRRSSRSPYRPPPSDRRRSRTPHRRGYSDRPPTSRTPPPRRRSRSRTPYRSRERYSRSPRRREEYRRSRYTPPRDERGYPPGAIPAPYFEGAEFWIPDPTLQPRFIPRPIVPPGMFAPFGAPFQPRIPIMMPRRAQFRPRIVYNSGSKRPGLSEATPSTSVVSSTAREQESAEEVPKDEEQSSEKTDK